MLSPGQRTTYQGVVWDSITMQARMSPAQIESILTTVKRVSEGWSLTVKQFKKIAGSDGSCVQRGLMYMRPLQWWFKTKRFSPRGNSLCMIKDRARKLFLPDLRDHHMLVRTDNTKVISYINHQGDSAFAHPHNPCVVLGQTTLAESSSHSWTSQYGSRHSVEAGAEARGMEASPRGGKADMESLWPDSGGPVAIQKTSQ